MNQETLDRMLVEIIALRKVLEHCLEHIDGIASMASGLNTAEVMGEDSKISMRGPLTDTEKKKEASDGLRDPTGYVVKTAGKYKDCNAGNLALTNKKNFRDYIKENWKVLHADDKQYFKQMVKDGKL